MTEYQLPRVDFPVWDLDGQPPLAPVEFSSIRSADGTIVAVGISRGAELGSGAGVGIWSFAPQALEDSRWWHLEHAVSGLASPYARAVNVPLRDAVRHLSTLKESGRPTRFTADGEQVEAVMIDVYRDWWVLASNDHRYGVAIVSTGRGRQSAAVRQFRLLDESDRMRSEST